MFLALRHMSKYMSRHKAGILLGAVCLVQKYDFEANGITNSKLERYREENQLSSIQPLIVATVICPVCEKRQVINNKVPGIDYCECPEGSNVPWRRSYDGWTPFLEQRNILVWRKSHHKWPHLYAYKVYGHYDDVCLGAFMETQISAQYRTEWDPAAVELHVLQSDATLLQRQFTHDNTYSAQDLIYWLVKFPSFFSNRDYVFMRRYHADTARREVVIVNEAVDGVVPGVAGVHRVLSYWSVMVVRSTQSYFTQPGIEYVLCYFDNPGTNLPATITNFIASTAFPNFLSRLHDASLSLQRRYEAGETVYASLPHDVMTGSCLQKEDRKTLPETTKLEKEAWPDLLVRDVMEALGEMQEGNDGTKQLISEFKDQIRQIRAVSKKKKEDSQLTLQELDLRHNRYEDGRTQSAMVQQLFKSIKLVLSADHEMRTGEGLLRNEPKEGISKDKMQSNAKRKCRDELSSNICDENSCCSKYNTYNGKEHTQDKSELYSCNLFSSEDCTNSELLSNVRISWSDWLYSVFLKAPLSYVKLTSKCTYDNVPVDTQLSSDGDRTPEDGCNTTSVRYYAYGWLVWRTYATGREEQTEGHQPWYWRAALWLYSYLRSSG